jgi:hypothetical protein
MMDIHDERGARAGDQLQQISTPHSNSVLRGPEGTDVGDLHCELARDPRYESIVTVSAWELDDKQREWLAAGAHVRLSVWTHPTPPVAVAIEPPFCVCGSETIYVRSEKQFQCPRCGQPVEVGTPPDGNPKLEIVGDATSPTERAEAEVKRDFSPAPDDEEPPPAAA